MTIYYCYNDKCPIRSEKEPWPRSDYVAGWVKIISKNGKSYKRRGLLCAHCGEEMTGTYDLYEEGYY